VAGLIPESSTVGTGRKGHPVLSPDPPPATDPDLMRHRPRTLLPALLVPTLLLASAGGLERPLVAQAPPDHDGFSRVLEQVVYLPRVDYERLAQNRDGLDRYVAALSRTDPASLSRASRDDQLAFWINAYNACMLLLVVDNYPIRRGRVGLFRSIRNRVAGYPDNSVWQIRDVFTRDHCPVAGERRSQDEIEHEIIRPRFQEPRIHFAVNCAAISCPVLWPEAYSGEELDEQLDRAVRNLMADPGQFRLERGSPAVLHLNKVLDWYQEDFDGTEGLKRFFAGYLEEPERELVLRPDTRVEFFEYDWTLNDVER
jgi:hypothetical protein